MKSCLLFLLALLAGFAAIAQNTNQIGSQAAQDARDVLRQPDQTEGRKNQKVQRIRLEDSGSTIDEVRYGGQTQSITVQPKANVPEYGIGPADFSRSRPADHREGLSGATGQRFWNVLRF